MAQAAVLPPFLATDFFDKLMTPAYGRRVKVFDLQAVVVATTYEWNGVHFWLGSEAVGAFSFHSSTE